MTAIKQIDELIQNAGIENIGSFMHNLAMVFDQELGALKCAAEENAAVNHRCPECGTPITTAEREYLSLCEPQNSNKPFLRLAFECPSCAQPLSAHIIMVNVEKLPF